MKRSTLRPTPPGASLGSSPRANVTLEPDRSIWLDTLLRLAHKRFQTFIVSAPGDPLEVVRALAELAPRLRDQAGEMGVS
jgi:hypothetical protein